MIERLYPGVFLTEVAFEAHPIEGVPTHAPDWTDANKGDPGITLLSLFAWTGESLAYRANAMTASPLSRHAVETQAGIASGLEIGAPDTGRPAAVSVTPGLALRPDGQIVQWRVPLLLRLARRDGDA